MAGGGVLRFEEVARFWNGGVRLGGTLYWDFLHLWRNVIDGLAASASPGGAGGSAGRGVARRDGARRLDSVGVDSWAVDYGLLDRRSKLIANPLHYRDRRAAGAVEAVHAVVGPAELYRRTGIAHLPFNTCYQLVADRDAGMLGDDAEALLLPDLFGFFLTGERGTELTNASTTGLLAAGAEAFDVELFERLELPRALFPPLRRPGALAGELSAEVLAEIAVDGPVQLVAVASHDTASAVVAVPAAAEHFAYLSSGTWSLLGVELARPVLTEAARLAGFTNERGLDGTTRFLRNVMGLWLLAESQRADERAGRGVPLETLLAEAARLPPLERVIDPDDPRFLAPGDMAARIAESCIERGEPVPASSAENARCILDSLALDYRRHLEAVSSLSGVEVEVLHIVGGGSRNTLLCQLTADACGIPVVAGPSEAAAIGNLLVQARSLGVLGGDLAALRAVVAGCCSTVRYEPDARSTALFAGAARRLAR
ncbi:MAG TPA: rhamnulokinase family protein [Acidimicrobiales bacterium]|nr:rhamnulokinase family protein [Acidimicrobiales bacterium]